MTISRCSNDGVARMLPRTPTGHGPTQTEQRCELGDELEASSSDSPGSQSLQVASLEQSPGLHPTRPRRAPHSRSPLSAAHVSPRLEACREWGPHPSQDSAVPRSLRLCWGHVPSRVRARCWSAPRAPPPSGRGLAGEDHEQRGPRAAGAPPPAAVNAGPCGPAQRPAVPGRARGASSRPRAVRRLWPHS